MERAIEALIAQPLAKVILERPKDHRREICVRAVGDQVQFASGEKR